MMAFYITILKYKKQLCQEPGVEGILRNKN